MPTASKRGSGDALGTIAARNAGLSAYSSDTTRASAQPSPQIAHSTIPRSGRRLEPRPYNARPFREPPIELTPALVLATWAAGLAGGAAVVAWWRVVGTGFVWLSSGIVVLFGIAAVGAGAGPFAIGATVVAVFAAVAARNQPAAAGLFALAAVGYLAASFTEGDVVPAVTGALAMGAMTSEMVLGHWYLVDPRLPRWALRRLDVAAALGLALDIVVLTTLGVFGWDPVDAVIGWAFVALAAMSLLLAVAVWFALREPSYSGVMAATGLSYLAVLTVFGAVVTGRVLLDAAAS